jgi:hypothetical protein
MPRTAAYSALSSSGLVICGISFAGNRVGYLDPSFS